MPSKIGFLFPIDNSDGWDGFNHAGIEHFSGGPFTGVGREVPQNVLDATDQPPARIEIKRVEVPRDSIPNRAELVDVMKRCEAEAKKESDKAVAFFKTALAILDKPKVSVLQISDYNTTGVSGPCKNGTPYFALMKATGQSKKPNSESIGSFGIGKFAPFVVSSLRTVFVSTVWKEGSKWNHYVQGKSILMSHYDKSGKTRDGTGYWGIKDGCAPHEGFSDDCPAWLMRAKTKVGLPKKAGTTLSILGFNPAKGWEEMIAAAIAENFFGTIARKKLIVDVNGTHHIDDQTISEIFDDQQIRSALLDVKGQPDRFDHSALFSKALSSSETIIEQTENLHLGKCELRILVGEDLPKKVAVLRDGMLITDELEGLRRFGDFKEFVAVLECQSQKGNALLKAMEPPRHDDFEPDRLTEQDRRKGRTALREITAWVRQMLKRHAQDPVSEVTNIEELKDFFADDAEGAGKDGEENPVGNVIIRARPVIRKARSEFAGGAEADGDGENEQGNTADAAKNNSGASEKSGVAGGGDGGGAQGKANAGAKGGSNHSGQVVLSDVRSVPTGKRRRRVSFTPQFTGEVRIAVEDSGADANYRLRIVGASEGSVANGTLHGINVVAGQRTSLDVELERDFDGAMRVSADAI